MNEQLHESPQLYISYDFSLPVNILLGYVHLNLFTNISVAFLACFYVFNPLIGWDTIDYDVTGKQDAKFKEIIPRYYLI